MKEKGKDETTMNYYIIPGVFGEVYRIFCEKCVVDYTQKEQLTEAQKAGLDVQCDNCGENN